MNELAAFVVIWLITYLLHSTLLYAAAWLVERGRLLRAPASREHLWRAAMLGALVTASVQSAGLVERVPLRTLFAAAPQRAAQRDATPLAAADAPAASVAPASAVAAVAPAASPVPPVAPVGPVAARAPLAAVTSVAPVAAPDTAAPAVAGWRAALQGAWDVILRQGPGLLLVLWLAGAVFGVLRLRALGSLARRELAGRAPAAGPLAAEFALLCAGQRVARPELRVAPALSGPISLPNGEIVLPPWTVDTLDVRQRRAMLAHELAHQVRRDPQWLLALLGLHALLWLQPLHGLARRRLAALAELQADAWAARAVDDPRAVAECLAECAGHVTADRAALFGAAMANESLLVERVERLLEGMTMHVQKASWALRGGVLAALSLAAFLLPGCDTHSLRMSSFGSSTSVTISDGGDTSVTVTRGSYELHMEVDGAATFLDDESDLATLEPGCTFELSESLDGVTHEYKVKAAPSGALTRSYRVDGADAPVDAASQAWVAAALPRMFRESGFDIEARVERLLARGGPEAVLAEVDAATSDNAKATYLGRLLGVRQLDDAQAGLALAAAAKIDSDYDLRTALDLALSSQTLDPVRTTQLLTVAQQLGSDYERAELLVAAVKTLPDDAAARTAWLAAADGLDSDYELGRTLKAGLDRSRKDAAFTAQLVALAAARIGSDYELGEVLKQVAPRAGDPALAAAYLAAAGELGSDYERRGALVELVGKVSLDAASLAKVLDVTAGIGSDYERSTALKATAPHVASDAALSRRYREVASTMGDYERGAALLALDEATPR